MADLDYIYEVLIEDNLATNEIAMTYAYECMVDKWFLDVFERGYTPVDKPVVELREQVKFDGEYLYNTTPDQHFKLVARGRIVKEE